MDLERRLVWVGLFAALFFVGMVLIALVVHSLTQAVFLAFLLLPVAAAGSTLLQPLFLYTPRPHTVALIEWRGGERVVRPGEWAPVVPFWHRVVAEVPRRMWDVLVYVSTAYTRDQIPVECVLYLSCRFDPCTSRAPATVLREYDEAKWQGRVQRAVHDALLRRISCLNSKEILRAEVLAALEDQVRQLVAEPLHDLGVTIDRFYWQSVRPQPAIQKAIDRLKEARSEGAAVYSQLREISQRFHIRPEDPADLLMLALAAALAREGDDQARINLSLRVSPDESEPEGVRDKG